MPLTPFLGVSVLLHLAIIAGHRAVRYMMPNTQVTVAPHPYRPVFLRLVSFLTIVTVFFFVLTNAFFLVRASLTGEYSSIKVVESILHPASAMAFFDRDLYNLGDYLILSQIGSLEDQSSPRTDDLRRLTCRNEENMISCGTSSGSQRLEMLDYQSMNIGISHY